MRKLALPAAIAMALLVPRQARAFCGFYVGGADAKLFADATQVVLMREGTRTVLSMQNDYKGPPERFAMVVPVPTVLAKEQVKTLPRDVFDKVDQLGAPRLVEYWEQDPCPQPGLWGDAIGEAFGAGGLGLSGVGEGGGGAAALGVKVEARFAVGEYDIVILGAKDSAGLETWLHQEKYAIPSDAEPLLRPYVQSGMKFFVAKVDPARVKFEGGRATLSPLRFHYDSDAFSLPVRLGLVNSSGTQDLVVNILAKKTRYEVANYANVTIPTNLDVTEAARPKFGEFYAALFDKTLEKNPGAVVTEYAWDAGTCDPCPGPTLDGDDLATLGADVVAGGTEGLRSSSGRGQGLAVSIREGTPVQIRGPLPPEVVRRIVRQSYGRMRLCYQSGLASKPGLKGTVTTSFQIDKDGSVSSVKGAGGDLMDPSVRACIASGFAAMSFPAPDGTPVTVTYPLAFDGPGSPGARAASAPRIGSTPYVLTRLHVRYGKASLGRDLVFKSAGPIVGGRERVGADGTLEKSARPDTTNNFQARYAVRHPWKGPVTCKEPRRNVWGGPPDPTTGPVDPVAARKTAFAARGAGLASFFSGAVPEIGVATPAADPGDGPIDAGPEPAKPVGDGGGASAPPPAPRGCGGCVVGSPGQAPPVLTGSLVAALTWLRRRRRR